MIIVPNVEQSPARLVLYEEDKELEEDLENDPLLLVNEDGVANMNSSGEFIN